MNARLGEENPSAPLHVAVNAINVAPGGALTVLLSYLRALAPRGDEVRFTVIASRESVLDAVNSVSDVTVLGFGHSGSLVARYWQSYFLLPRVIRSLRPDVLWSTNLAVRNVDCPQVVHHQNLHFFERSPAQVSARDFLRHRLGMLEALRSYRLASAHVYISRYMQNAAQRRFPRLSKVDRAIVIYNGVERKRIQRSPRRFPGDRLRVLLIGSDSPHKDPTAAVRALEMLQRRRGLPAELDVVGVTKTRRLVALAESLDVGDLIRWHGFIPESKLEGIYLRSDILFFPSRFEGFGIPLAEAMAAGLPVVARANTAIPEVLGNAGILLRRYDDEEVARAIETLTKSPKQYERASEAALTRAHQLTIENSADALLSLFRRVCPRRGGGTV